MNYEGTIHVRKDYTQHGGTYLYWTWFAPSLAEGRQVEGGACKTVRLLGDAEFRQLFGQLGFDAKIIERTIRELSTQGATSIGDVRLSDENIQRYGLESTVTLSHRQTIAGAV